MRERGGALPFPKLTLAWDSQANRVFSLGEILPSSKPRQPGEKPRKASCKLAWGGAWGRGELGGDVMEEMSPHAAAGSATPSNGTSEDNTFDAWLARVKAARPALTSRAQEELARLAKEDWPELAHALVLAEQHWKSRSCNSLSGFSDALVTCRGGSRMMEMLADAFLTVCVEVQVTSCATDLLRCPRAIVLPLLL